MLSEGSDPANPPKQTFELNLKNILVVFIRAQSMNGLFRFSYLGLSFVVRAVFCRPSKALNIAIPKCTLIQLTHCP